MSAPNTQTAGILLLVAAAAIIVGIVTKSLFTVSVRGSKITANIGLLGAEVCGIGDDDYGGDSYGGDCKSMPAWENAEGDISAARMLALGGGFAAAALSAVAGILAFQRKKLPPALIHVAVGVAAAGVTYLLVKVLTDDKVPDVQNSISYSGLVMIAGLATTSFVVKSMLGGVAPAAGVAAPPQYAAATAPCTRCGRPAQFVTQYQRWYCPSCQQYL